MTRDYVTEIVEAKSLAQAQYVFALMENALSPLEMRDAAPRLRELPAAVRVLLAASVTIRHLEKAEPQPYRSSQLCDGARLFSDPSVSAERKSLLLAFAGTSQRVMLPMSLFAQLLPADRFDILLLADRRNISFSNGIDGLRGPFAEFVQNIAEQVGASTYAARFTLGTSMGALPALRAGRLLKVQRAVAIGPVFPWEVKSLLSPGKTYLPSFDLLCACGPGREVPCVAAFSGGHERDRSNAERLGRMSGVELMPFDRYTTHNLVNLLYRDGELPAFLGRVLNFHASTASASRVPAWFRFVQRGRRLLRRGWARLNGKELQRSYDPLDQDSPSP